MQTLEVGKTMTDANHEEGRREGAKSPSPVGAVAWDHEALLYDDDDILCDSVADFLSDGIRLGDPLVVLSTRPRRNALIRRLEAQGLDWHQARHSRRLKWMDARTTLESIMIGREPDAGRFDAYVGDVIRSGVGEGEDFRVRAYGEMADLLWRDGDNQAALLVEDLWNELARTRSFSLLCAYSRGNLYRESGRRSWREVCQRHTHVSSTEESLSIPAEGTGGSGGSSGAVPADE